MPYGGTSLGGGRGLRTADTAASAHVADGASEQNRAQQRRQQQLLRREGTPEPAQVLRAGVYAGCGAIRNAFNCLTSRRKPSQLTDYAGARSSRGFLSRQKPLDILKQEAFETV